MAKKYFTLLLMVCTCCFSQLNAQSFANFKKEVYQTSKDTLAYRILYPENFNPQKKYPVLFFLHGSGERGNDNEAQLRNGGHVFLEEKFRKQHQAVIIFPQCAKESFWANAIITRNAKNNAPTSIVFTTNKQATSAMHALESFVKHMLKEDYVNTKQVYIGGLSMGGMGTFELLWRKPKVFAAAFAICGGAHPETAKKYARKVPVWIFHGAKDDIVPPIFSQQMYDAIKANGGDAKLTIYPNDNHNSWDSALAEPGLFNWLFSHQK
ncbi:carboxylesterase family protein [Mucilaginibacter aquatilis]|uniref:Prolyl oligopeptidase family serine peptidase n=1 Tax=Mucilaginibacter aquatilis TaxID=1517760 RepID=A0A6I4I5B2_9SPHI|nr:prolyl oligopeptidase family serine peptidase [Mucilaginibacter aquatilis]MVN90385.1 prolyl oligopeptidase family serine peptidase [Mucilaginibacter aquatilis]